MQGGRGPQSASEKVSTGILLNRIPSPELRFVARELHESLLDLPSIWAPSEVFVHESIAYRLRGRAFVHMAPPLASEGVELHVPEGMYSLHVLQEMAKGLPDSAETTVVENAPHRHTKGGELVVHVSRENLRDVLQFVVRLYRRARGV
ncbi:MAG: hypothetical protein ACOC8A_01430 [bacterium]